MTPADCWHAARELDDYTDRLIDRVQRLRRKASDVAAQITTPEAKLAAQVRVDVAHERLTEVNRAMKWLDDMSTYVSGDAHIELPGWIELALDDARYEKSSR